MIGRLWGSATPLESATPQRLAILWRLAAPWKLEAGDTLGIGSVFEVRGEADFDFGDSGFDDPIGGGEQKFDSIDSFDSVDAKLELICAYESSCSCDDSMPLTSGGSSASVRSGTSGAEGVEEVEEWKKSLVSTDLTLQSMQGLTRSN